MENRQLIKRLLQMLLPYKRCAIAGVILGIVRTVIETALLPMLFTMLLFAVIGSEAGKSGRLSIPVIHLDFERLVHMSGTPSDRMSVLLWLAVALVVVVVLKCICQGAQNYLIQRFSQTVARDLRQQLFAKMLSLSPAEFDSMRVGAWTVRITWDVVVLRDCIGAQLFDCLQSPFGIVLSVAMMLAIDWRLTLIALVTAPAIALFVSAFGHKLRKLNHEIQNGLSSLNATLTELIGGMRVIQSFGRESHEIARIESLNDEYYRSTMSSVMVSEVLMPGIELVTMVGIVAGFVVGGMAVFHRSMSAENFILFMALGQRVGNQINVLAKISQIRQKLDVAVSRICDLLDRVPAIRDHADACPVESVEGRVTFEDLSFRYGTGETVLNEINLDVAPGEVIALVGHSGAGKTSLVNLIPRFYDPTYGRVLVDGRDLRRITLTTLRDHIAIVPQDTLLFSDSIAENIRYGRLDATDEEVRRAAIDANAMEFIERMSEGMATLVGERGARLSGGQRQRIAIARAMLRGPRILVLDEATSSLDTASEHLVQQALNRLMQGRTTFVIAHRLSTVRSANRIVVLHHGRIVEIGTHDQLLHADGIYRELYDMQFGADQTDGQYERI